VLGLIRETFADLISLGLLTNEPQRFRHTL